MSRSLNDTELKRLHRSWRRATDARLALLLEHVKGPYNVGSIMRTAAAMHVDVCYVVGFDSSWTDAKVQKTAMGTHRFLDLRAIPDTESAIAAVKEDGFRLVGLELATDAKPMWELDLTGDICIAVGHEDRGVTPQLLNACDAVAYAPLLGRVGSLNVATAASIACYEVRRQGLSGSGAVLDA